MELTEAQIIEKYGKNACIVQEKLYYHMTMNLFVSQVDGKLLNKKMSLQKANEKKITFLNKLK